jgi:hypothetical protein
MEGPWYNIAEALSKLNIIRSELRYLISNNELQPIVYTKPRSFLLFTRDKEGWTGLAVCKYRGHLLLHKECIATLLDEAELTLGKGSGILLEEHGILDWNDTYPFERETPNTPVIDWQSTDRNDKLIHRVAATPLPSEGFSLSGVLATSLASISAQSNSEAAKNIQSLTAKVDKGLILHFDENSKFSPSDLRIASSEINKYLEMSQKTASQLEMSQHIESIKHLKRGAGKNLLHLLIDEILAADPNIGAKNAWRIIESESKNNKSQFEYGSILEAVDSDCITWEDNNGKLHSLRYGSFGPTLSRRKELRSTS